MDLVTATGKGVSVEMLYHSPEEYASASRAQRLLWLAGMPDNCDGEEDLEDDWSLDPWLYGVRCCGCVSTASRHRRVCVWFSVWFG